MFTSYKVKFYEISMLYSVLWKKLSYDLMILDTFSYLERDMDLYYKLGFKVIKKYYNSLIKDWIYLGLDLKNKAN